MVVVIFPRPKPTIEKTGCREKLARYLSPHGKFSGKGVEVVTALPGAPALELLQPEAHRNDERHRPAGRRRRKRRGAMDHLPDLLVEACDAAAAHQRDRGHAAGAVEAEGDAGHPLFAAAGGTVATVAVGGGSAVDTTSGASSGGGSGSTCCAASCWGSGCAAGSSARIGAWAGSCSDFAVSCVCPAGMSVPSTSSTEIDSTPTLASGGGSRLSIQ